MDRPTGSCGNSPRPAPPHHLLALATGCTTFRHKYRAKPVENGLTGGDDDDIGPLEGVGETIGGKEALDLGGGVNVREVDRDLGSEHQQKRSSA